MSHKIAGGSSKLGLKKDGINLLRSIPSIKERFFVRCYAGI